MMGGNDQRGKLRLLVKSLKQRSLISRFFRYIRRHGILNTLNASLSLSEYFFDIRYGTDTITWVQPDAMGIEDDAKQHATAYQPSSARPVKKLLRTLNIPHGKVFVDLGCGKGLVLMIASKFGIAEVRGVELSPALCTIARKNAALFKNKNTSIADIVVTESDVLKYPIGDDEDVFYLYNPFDGQIMDRVMRNIAASLQHHNRKIWIIYNNARHNACIVDILRPTGSFYYLIRPQDFIVHVVDRV